MKFYYKPSFLGKGLAAICALLLASNVANAQVATIYNTTACDMVVEIVTVDAACVNATCSTTVVIPFTGTTPITVTMPCGQPIVHVNVTADPLCSFAPTPLISLDTPDCGGCGGTDTDSGSFTAGGVTVNATSSCTGSFGSPTVAIW